jgi:predicted transcriptional regulator
MHDEADRHAAGVADGGSRRPAGALEAEVLAVLQAADGPLSPGQVQRLLAARQPAELSYSTVVTIMSRLHAKGLLTRERAGRGFIYTPVDAASVAARRMGRALDAGPSHDAVLVRFASGLSSRDARLLRQLLADSQDQD